LEQHISSIPCGFLSLNSDYLIEAVNDTFLEWTHLKKDKIIGQHIETLLSAGNKLMLHSLFYPQISEHHLVEELFVHIYNGAHEKLPCILNAKAYELNGKRAIDIVIMPMKKRFEYEQELRMMKKMLEKAYDEKEQAYNHLQQIYFEIEQKQKELLEINKELIEISNTDKLTKIANRRYFQNQLATHIDLFESEHIPFALLIIDIDYFKQVNDLYGHQIGDEVLVKLATILKDSVRYGDTVARFGGEEFTILLANTKSTQAMEMAKHLKTIVENEVWPTSGNLTISIGCAVYSSGDTEDTLIQHADDALYYSKRNGRNQATLFEMLNK
jgi:diguanylate cyclase